MNHATVRYRTIGNNPEVLCIRPPSGLRELEGRSIENPEILKRFIGKKKKR
jgi:hypothetical protein